MATKVVRTAALLLVLSIAVDGRTQEPPAKQPPAPPELAVIVNLTNPTTGLTLAELRAHCKLEVQFWDGERAQLFLPRYDTPEMKILLQRVYGMTPSELRKYWIGRVFRGEIPAEPTVVPTTDAAVKRVRDRAGAFSVVMAKDVPEGVRVLTIDGKRPGEAGYALQAAAGPAPAPAPEPKAGAGTPDNT